MSEILNKLIVDAASGEEIISPLSAEELVEHKLRVESAAKDKSDLEAKAAQRAVLLDKLGITEEEAKLLLS